MTENWQGLSSALGKAFVPQSWPRPRLCWAHTKVWTGADHTPTTPELEGTLPAAPAASLTHPAPHHHPGRLKTPWGPGGGTAGCRLRGRAPHRGLPSGTPGRYLRGDAEALEDVVEEQLLQLQLHGHVAVEGRAEQPAQRLGAAQVVAHLSLGSGSSAGSPAASRQRAEPQQGLGGDGGVGGRPARPGLEGAVVDHQRHRLRAPHGRAGRQHRVRGPARVAEGEHPARRHLEPSPLLPPAGGAEPCPSFRGRAASGRRPKRQIVGFSVRGGLSRKAGGAPSLGVLGVKLGEALSSLCPL